MRQAQMKPSPSSKTVDALEAREPRPPTRYELHQRDAERELRELGLGSPEAILYAFESRRADLDYWHGRAMRAESLLRLERGITAAFHEIASQRKGE